MIPLFWRYLIREQMKVTSLCLLGFILLLLLLRVEEIARFATLGAPFQHILIFILMMLPQILQLSIPLAICIGVYSSCNRMSQSCELLGVITSGISLSHFLSPLICFALFWSSLNGFVSLVWAPKAQLEMKLMKTYWSQLNPSHLLKSERMWPFPSAVALCKQNGSEIDVTLISRHGRQNSTQLFYFDSVDLSQTNQITTQGGSHIIFYPEEHTQYLSLENTSAGTYSFLLDESSGDSLQSFAVDQVPFNVLLHDILSPEEDSLDKTVVLSELARRLFFLVLPFGFAFMGAQASFKPDRRSRGRLPFELIIWAISSLTFYFIAKSGFPSWKWQIAFYLLPSFIGSLFGIYLLIQKRNPQ